MPIELTKEQIDELINYDRRRKRKPQIRFDFKLPEVELTCTTPCTTCGGLRDDSGYCLNADCSVDSPILTYDCRFCGHCDTPGRCVSSVECPTCGAIPGGNCVDFRTKSFVVFHEERWDLVQALYGTHYMGNDNKGFSQKAYDLLIG